jgi:hypothetical protein
VPQVTDLDGLSSIMSLLRDVRERESTLELDLAAVLDLYRMLEHYLPGGLVSEEEARERALIRVTWRRLLDFAEEVQITFSELYAELYDHFPGDALMLCRGCGHALCSDSTVIAARSTQQTNWIDDCDLAKC